MFEMFSKAITESNYFGTDEILARDRPANRSVFDGKTVSDRLVHRSHSNGQLEAPNGKSGKILEFRNVG